MKRLVLLILSVISSYSLQSIANVDSRREFLPWRGRVYCVSVTYRDPKPYCNVKNEDELEEIISSHHPVGHLVLSTPTQLLSLYPGTVVDQTETLSTSSRFTPYFEEKEGEKALRPLIEAIDSIQKELESTQQVPSIDYRNREKLSSVPHSAVFFFLNEEELKALDEVIQKVKNSTTYYVADSHITGWLGTHNCVTCIATALNESDLRFKETEDTEIYTPWDGYRKLVEYLYRNETRFYPTFILWKDFKGLYQALHTFNKSSIYNEKAQKYEKRLKNAFDNNFQEIEAMLPPLTTEESMNFILSRALAVKEGAEERIKEAIENGRLKVSKAAYYQLDRLIPSSSPESSFNLTLGQVLPSFAETIMAWNDFTLETSEKSPLGIKFLGSSLFSGIGTPYGDFVKILADPHVTGGVRLSNIVQVYSAAVSSPLSHLSLLTGHYRGTNSLEERYVFKRIKEEYKTSWQAFSQNIPPSKWIYGGALIVASPAILKILKRWKPF